MRLATGKDVIIGHDLESCTADIQEIDVQIDEKTVTLIDTPGFDDTNKSDTEILTVIANYLESRCVLSILSPTPSCSNKHDTQLSPEPSLDWRYLPSSDNRQSHDRR
jgi:predicted GTPase